MMETQLPVTLGAFAAAILPILVLLVLLVGRSWSASAAAPVAFAVSVLMAFWLFQTSWRTIAVASGKGIWDAIFILYVVWPALILYQVADHAGAFQSIQKGVLRLIPDRLLVILVFAWVLTSFIQSIAGFGAPLAVVAPILLGLGVKPLYAVLLPIIGGSWANSFGSLGTPWFALTSVVDVPDPDQTMRIGALLVWIANLSAGMVIAWMYGRMWAIKRGLPAILIISLLHGGLLTLLLPSVTPIAMLIACSAGLAAALLLSRWSFYSQEDEDEPDRIFDQDKIAAAKAEGGGEQPAMKLTVAFAPYIFLGVVAVAVLTIGPIRSALETISIGPPFPASSTGFGVTEEATEAYAAFAPLTHPGTFLLLAALFGYLFYNRRDRYSEQTTVGRLFKEAAADALPVTISISALLLMSGVMSHSGQITVLALGVSAVSSSGVYLAAANFIGILGSLTTSSNTSSNVLFSPLQATAAEAEGVPVSLALAAQAAGAAVGNAISPADALMGATTVGDPSLLGGILRRAIPWALLTGVLVSLATLGLWTVMGSGS